MKIIDAETQLLEDIEEEMAIITTHTTKNLTIHAGRHPTLGRIVLIVERNKGGAIVEME